MDEATERAKLMAEDRANRNAFARERRMCTCGAAGTSECHSPECDAAKEFNPAGTKWRTITKGRGPKTNTSA